MRLPQGGFTLIELMVAVAISMVGVIAGTQLYGSSQTAARIQGMQARLVEDGRFGLFMLERVISQAGYQVVPSSDVRSDRIGLSGTTLTVKFQADGATQIFCDGSVGSLTSPVTEKTLVISRGSVDVTAASPPRYKLQCQDGTNPAEDWIAPVMTAGAKGIGTEVMDFGIQLGVDSGPAGTPADYGCGIAAANGTKPRDCIVDSYVASLANTQTGDQIVAVKVCLVLRSQEKNGGVTKAEDVKNCAGTAIAGSQTDGRMYRSFSSTVLLKNI